MGELRVVRAQGTPLRRGRQVGRELADLIQRSVAFYHRYLERRGVTSARLHDLLRPYLLRAEERFPEATDVLKGMSLGATVPTLELFAINAFEELEPLLESPEGGVLFLRRKEGYVESPPPGPAAERCSSVALAAGGRTLFAHNEHWLAGDAGNVAVVVDEPEDGVPVASPTVVCCLPAVGLNGHGTAQGIGSLTASDDRVGIPRVLVSRSSLQAADRSDAVARAAEPGRAGGYAHVFGFPGADAMVVETTATEHRILEGPAWHTNHYVDPDLAAMGPPPSEGSQARYARLAQLIEERRPTEPEDLMAIMSDHASAPQAICQHADEAEGEEASAVLFSVVCDVDARRMWVAPGNPCTAGYREVDVAELGA
jgi:isopenicillin-N N-acyltransferase-like protein